MRIVAGSNQPASGAGEARLQLQLSPFDSCALAVRSVTFGKGACLRAGLEIVFQFRVRHPNSQMFRAANKLRWSGTVRCRARALGSACKPDHRTTPSTSSRSAPRRNEEYFPRRVRCPSASYPPHCFQLTYYQGESQPKLSCRYRRRRGIRVFVLEHSSGRQIRRCRSRCRFSMIFIRKRKMRPQKSFDERRLKMLIDVLRSADLLDAALVHERQPRPK